MDVQTASLHPTSPFRSLSKARILDDLATSRQQIENGGVVDFDQAIDEIEALNDL